MMLLMMLSFRSARRCLVLFSFFSRFGGGYERPVLEQTSPSPSSECARPSRRSVIPEEARKGTQRETPPSSSAHQTSHTTAALSQCNHD